MRKVVTAAAAVLALPLLGSDYALSFMVQLFVFAALAYSWNLIGGYAGYGHFGQMGFFGAGAYVGSLLTLAGVPWPLAAVIAGASGALLALPLGAAMLRLNGPFFAIGMFGMARVLESFALEFDTITHGGTGLVLPLIYDLHALYYMLAAIAIGLLVLTWRLDNSRLGLKLLAIREDEVVAQALGIRTTRLKIATFVASAVAPAMVGALYAVHLSFIDPGTAFTPSMELTTIAMVLLGGMGTVFGPLIGAVVLSAVNELLWARFPEVHMALVGVVILVVVLFMPRGITSFAQQRSWPWLPPSRGSFKHLADQSAQQTRLREATPRL